MRGGVVPDLGKPRTSKTDEFSIQKFILQFFAIIDDTSVMNFGNKLQYDMFVRKKIVVNFAF